MPFSQGAPVLILFSRVSVVGIGGLRTKHSGVQAEGRERTPSWLNDSAAIVFPCRSFLVAKMVITRQSALSRCSIWCVLVALTCGGWQVIAETDRYWSTIASRVRGFRVIRRTVCVRACVCVCVCVRACVRVCACVRARTRMHCVSFTQWYLKSGHAVWTEIGNIGLSTRLNSNGGRRGKKKNKTDTKLTASVQKRGGGVIKRLRTFFSFLFLMWQCKTR